MIKVRVRNFQSLRDAELTIQGLTVVTGTNNSGKSALFRAIHGAFQNARGSDFVRHGASHASVLLTFEDGQTLLWEKGKSVNRYEVNGVVLDKVRHGAPKEVEDFGVRPISAGNREHWPQIARQLDGVVFLFNEAGATMAEAVADIDRVGLLTRALRLSESDAYKNKEERRIRESDLEKFEDRYAVFDGVDDLKLCVDRLEVKHRRSEDLESKIKLAEDFRRKIQDQKAIVSALHGLDRIQQNLTGLGRVWSQVDVTQKRIRAFEALKTQMVSYTFEIQKAARFQPDMVRLESCVQRMRRVEQSKSTLRELKLHRDQYKDLLLNFQSEASRLDSAEKQLQQLHQDFHQLVAEEHPCPTCHRPLDRNVEL